MSQKTIEKHSGKKPASDLFPLAKGENAIAGTWATTAQLFPFTQMDDAALRRRAREINPAAAPPAPWIPAPKGARWEVLPTLRGLLAWQRHQLATAEARGLPSQCASMKDTETVFGFPTEMQQYAREHYHPKAGEQVIFESSNRVNLHPMLQFFRPLWKKLFCKGAEAIKGIEDFEAIDLDTQRALSAQQDVITKKRDNALAAHDLHTRDGIEKDLAEPLTTIFNVLKNYEKITGGKLKSLLTGAGVPPEIVQQAIATAAGGIQEPFAKLRARLSLNQPDPSEIKKAA